MYCMHVLFFLLMIVIMNYSKSQSIISFTQTLLELKEFRGSGRDNTNKHTVVSLSWYRGIIASKINLTPKGVHFPISKIHFILTFAYLLAHNNIVKFDTAVKFHYRVLQLTVVFWQSDTFGVTFILLEIVHVWY